MASFKSLFAFFPERINAALFIIKPCGLQADIKGKVDTFLTDIIRRIQTGMIVRFGIMVYAAETGCQQTQTTECLCIDRAWIKLRFFHLYAAVFARLVNNLSNGI